MSVLGKKGKWLFCIAALIVGFFVFDKFILYPILSKLEGLNRNINEKEKELRSNLRVLAQEEFIKSEYDRYTKDIRQKLSNEEETAQLLSEIEIVAKETDVSLTRMEPLRIDEKEFYREYVIRIEAEATISCLVDFLYKLERKSKLIRTDEFRLVPQQKKSSILKMNMIIRSILIFSRRPECSVLPA